MGFSILKYSKPTILDTKKIYGTPPCDLTGLTSKTSEVSPGNYLQRHLFGYGWEVKSLDFGRTVRLSQSGFPSDPAVTAACCEATRQSLGNSINNSIRTVPFSSMHQCVLRESCPNSCFARWVLHIVHSSLAKHWSSLAHWQLGQGMIMAVLTSLFLLVTMDYLRLFVDRSNLCVKKSC